MFLDLRKYKLSETTHNNIKYINYVSYSTLGIKTYTSHLQLLQTAPESIVVNIIRIHFNNVLFFCNNGFFIVFSFN